MERVTKKLKSNGTENIESGDTESVTSEESQKSSSKNRPMRSHKPNSLIFSAGIQPISLRSHRKRKMTKSEQTVQKVPESEQTQVPIRPLNRFGKRRGRPPKIRNNVISDLNEASKNAPLLSSLLNNTHAISTPMARTKTGRPKGRPRKNPMPPGSSTFLNISKRVTKKFHLPVAPGATCDCNTRYREHFQRFENKLISKHESQLQKLRKEVDDREKEKLKLQIKLSAMQHENQILRNKHMSSSNEIMLKRQIEDIIEQHKLEISQVKRKQWCANCEKEAIYFCCWNTSYCSLECQQHDWHATHKRFCRRGKH
ncbi:Zinc finger MYND domain-containing protein 11-like protein [Leptotrombidium deliense]|uniref:Zinc finger MYND domain-containing protein 11-like protein n=1 Tax=Leptotrombidium deliense TaxID=299467 RepID=A0A443SQS5_9ACAR|nr:Zinc finger MYND domain-containing protein 11-like protein [Leptotrombidium deliense]